MSFSKIPSLIQGCVLLRKIHTHIILQKEINHDDICNLRKMDKEFLDTFQVIIDDVNTTVYIPKRTLDLISIIERRIPELLKNMPLISEMSDKGMF